MRPSRPLPSGVVTFVLTDVVGSTGLWEAAPTAMEASLARHDEIVLATAERNDGVVIKSRGEGDSTFSVYARASDAVRAAYDLQIELAAHVWHPDASIQVRIAVHAGEATERDGDYLGPTVNRAARLREVAGAGEVVVSAAVAHLVADQLPAGTTLESIGPVRLRDVGRLDQVFVLAGRELPPPTPRRRGQPDEDLLATAGVTARERDVLDALADRLTNAEVAERFSISERTVETHVSSLLRKLDATNRLELATLAKDLEGSAPPALPAMVRATATRSTFVGRADQRAALIDCWHRASAGTAGLAVVTGEAGIGKSSIVAQLAIEAHRRGGRVLFGACSDGAPVPYQPFVEALTDLLAHEPEGRVRTDLGRHVEALARVVPEVANRLGTFAPTAGTDPLGERQAAQAGITAFLSAQARRHPALVVIEDLHWASAVTREAVLHVARHGGAAPLLLVVTTRDTAPELDPALLHWLAQAARLPSATVVPLAGLDLAATAELVTAMGGTIDATAAHHATGGNPLFLREVATTGVTGTTLQDFVADRFDRLDDADLHVVDVAGAIGESFRADVVAAAAQCSVAQVLAALDRAAAAGVVEPVAERARVFAFTHALFREARSQGISPGRRLHLHAAVFAALDGRDDDPAVVPELARHACIAAPLLTDPTRAVDLAEQAGCLTAAAGDHEEAAQHFRRALDVIDLAPSPDERRRLELTIRLGEAVSNLEMARGHAILRDATRQARRLGDAAGFADAVCSMTPEYGSVTPGRDDPAFLELGAEALSLLDHDERHWRARLLATLGTHHALGSDPVEGITMLRDAIAVARTGDPFDFVRAGLSFHFAADALDLDERIAVLHEVADTAQQIGHGAAFRTASERLAIAYRAAGDFERMRLHYRHAVDASPVRSIGLLNTGTIRAFLEGDLALTEERNAATQVVASTFGFAYLYSGPMALQVAQWRGAPLAARLEQRSAGSSFVDHSTRAWLGFSYLQEGRVDDLHRLLAAVRATGFDAIPRSIARSMVLALWGEVVASLGARDAAAQILQLLDPIAGQLADSAGMVWSSIDQVRAQLALALDDADRARQIASGAVDASRRRGTRLFLGRELVVLAAARARAGGDVGEIGALVAEAVDIGTSTGTVLIQRDLARHGLAGATTP